MGRQSVRSPRFSPALRGERRQKSLGLAARASYLKARESLSSVFHVERSPGASLVVPGAPRPAAIV